MKNSYFTLVDIEEIRLNIENSIFLGNGKEIFTKDEAKKYINEIKKKYPDATHSASGYIVNGEYGFDDDKESSGSSGIPILNALKKYDLNNIIIVVTRYFGGKKLGIRGLINAYGQAAVSLIEKGSIIERNKGYIYEIETSYGNAEKSIFKDLVVLEKIYLEKVCIKVFVKEKSLEEFEKNLLNLEHKIISKSEYIF